MQTHGLEQLLPSILSLGVLGVAFSSGIVFHRVSMLAEWKDSHVEAHNSKIDPRCESHNIAIAEIKQDLDHVKDKIDEQTITLEKHFERLRYEITAKSRRTTGE